LQAGIARFNVESRDELGLINLEAMRQGVIAHVAIRINPDVDALTHAKISTGMAENKFGIAIGDARTMFEQATGWPALCIDGLHAHIGSQLLHIEPIREAMRRLAQFQRALADAGHRIASIDVGGGLGVGYRTGVDHPISVADYVAVLRETFGEFDGRLILEPGRYLVAEAGLLLTRVVRIKPGRERQFLIVDAAMTELLRPALYDAWHEIVSLNHASEETARYDVVGPVCESGDTFALDRTLPVCRSGDLIAITCTGAYAASMASTYNTRPLAAEVMLESGVAALMRRRQSFDEMVQGEVI
jgi:diaminopimelate decarboxylase